VQDLGRWNKGTKMIGKDINRRPVFERAGRLPASVDGTFPTQPELDACRLKASGDGSSAQETQERNRRSSSVLGELLRLPPRATRLGLQELATFSTPEDLGRKKAS